KFQQKALKQTKQKKSKSAEFLMVKEDGGAMEGTGNPAFNMSSPDLSAQEASEKKVIRHDTRDRTLAAHQQKCRLQASAEPKGNEYSRNYFDPLMDEEINPRQCGMEVSQEDESTVEGTLSSEDPASSRKSLEHCKKDSEAISADSEEIERNTQENVILPGSSSLEQVLPPKKDVKLGMAFLFELFLLRGKYTYLHQAVGWATFPLYDSSMDVVEGKFKCPLLRGRYDQKVDSFKKTEDLICLDLDHWLCNLYFQVIKLPLHLNDQKNHKRHIQLPPEFPDCLMAEAESSVDNTEKKSCSSRSDGVKSFSHSSQGSISNKISPCAMDCDLSLSKEDRELHNKEKPTAWKTGETEDYSQDASYLEELEKHRFSVCRSSAAANAASGEFFKHLCFVLVSVFSELEFAQWQSQGFWYIILLMASLWFLRLYLHYLSQWFFLQATSTPVTKFRFSPLTVELCYPASSLHVAEEMLVVAVGPFLLNAVVLLLVLVRWGCQLLFAFCPDVLSKLIITMGLWAVLDPLAVFIVDTVLGWTIHLVISLGDLVGTGKLFQEGCEISEDHKRQLLILPDGLLCDVAIGPPHLLRLHNDSWILDTFQRIHSEESKFFIPYDLEISNQELSYIIKRSEQWRGLNGERRKFKKRNRIKEGETGKGGKKKKKEKKSISVAMRAPSDAQAVNMQFLLSSWSHGLFSGKPAEKLSLSICSLSPG
ncbi:hypothetical protein MJG53_017644, partial [Ovis ammon polii x Ovis aries]